MQKQLAWKLALVGLVALLLEIPFGMIRGLVAERKQARDGVIAEIARGSGEAQRIAGPILYIPWTRRSVETTTTTDESGRVRSVGKEKIERGQAVILPEDLVVEGVVEVQQKSRSLYKAHVYTLKATLRGRFALPPSLALPRGNGALEWGNAQLVVGVHDPRGLRGTPEIDWAGTRPAPVPGGLDAAGAPQGFHAELGAIDAPDVKARPLREFRVTLNLSGTERLEILPLGRATTVQLSSNWPHPSFTGRLLPEPGGKVSSEGFDAVWKSSHLSSNLAQLHQRCIHSRQCDAFQQQALAVSFLQPVDFYQAVERSVKYGFLFVGLSFAAFLIFEVLARLAIHPVQYAMVGLALAVFFLLLLSLAEHLGFAGAYALAATACSGLLGYYAAHVLGSARGGAFFGAALAALYGLLYVLLRSEDHALLMGSLLVFACLAAAMIATRKVDWYSVSVVRN